MLSKVHAKRRRGQGIVFFVASDMDSGIVCVARNGEQFICSVSAYVQPDFVFFGHIDFVYFAAF
jgi:hypothetical protein